MVHANESRNKLQSVHNMGMGNGNSELKMGIRMVVEMEMGLNGCTVMVLASLSWPRSRSALVLAACSLVIAKICILFAAWLTGRSYYTTLSLSPSLKCISFSFCHPPWGPQKSLYDRDDIYDTLCGYLCGAFSQASSPSHLGGISSTHTHLKLPATLREILRSRGFFFNYIWN